MVGPSIHTHVCNAVPLVCMGLAQARPMTTTHVSGPLCMLHSQRVRNLHNIHVSFKFWVASNMHVLTSMFLDPSHVCMLQCTYTVIMRCNCETILLPFKTHTVHVHPTLGDNWKEDIKLGIHNTAHTAYNTLYSSANFHYCFFWDMVTTSPFLLRVQAGTA